MSAGSGLVLTVVALMSDAVATVGRTVLTVATRISAQPNVLTASFY